MDWKLKNKQFPKYKSSIRVGKRNHAGQIITNEKELKELHLTQNERWANDIGIERL